MVSAFITIFIGPQVNGEREAQIVAQFWGPIKGNE